MQKIFDPKVFLCSERILTQLNFSKNNSIKNFINELQQDLATYVILI